SGSVRDPSGGAIPRASVVARNLSTGVETRTLSTETGDYSFPSLPVGTYSLKVGHQGFQTVERTDLRVVLGESLTVAIELPVGAVTETMRITAELPVVDTASSTMGTTRTLEEIADLPIAVAGNARRPLDFLKTMSGVSVVPGATHRSKASATG